MEEEGSGVRLGIDSKPENVFIGWCCLVKWNPGFRFAPRPQPLCWDGLSTRSTSTVCIGDRHAKRGVKSGPRKAQFVREGTLPEDCVLNGEVSDSWVYGLLRREWKLGDRRRNASW
jgi:[ribosomal protein S5]-alanine N-acetyltransferase